MTGADATLVNALEMANDWRPSGLPWAAELKERVTAMLADFVAKRRLTVTLTAADLAARLGPGIDEGLRFEIGRGQDGQIGLQGVSGSVLAIQSLALAFALASEAGGRVRQCPDPAPACGRYFIRKGKMDYCSIRCSRRVNARLFRAREKEKHQRALQEARRARKGGRR
jgi:hypothetical protein